MQSIELSELSMHPAIVPLLVIDLVHPEWWFSSEEGPLLQLALG